ncbi:hypothetical protein E3O11_10035 [Cryobacterium levicorallinum]|uniref:Uncharacterized protein n=1 Tax=Cryobacterium levicorallinum TaxID=995038 RepID=A0A4R8VL22_9MICO|nr:hypothetical protein E3O11_10035 [Cryobacterium levicorallinum]
MAPAADADLVIMGVGLAGLTLAARLARERSGPRVVLLEPRTAYRDDRSWWFWRPEQHDLSHLVSRRWKTWTFFRCGGLDRSAPSARAGLPVRSGQRLLRERAVRHCRFAARRPAPRGACRHGYSGFGRRSSGDQRGYAVGASGD